MVLCTAAARPPANRPASQPLTALAALLGDDVAGVAGQADGLGHGSVEEGIAASGAVVDGPLAVSLCLQQPAAVGRQVAGRDGHAGEAGEAEQQNEPRMHLK